jgi:hypothetical protein
VSVSCLVFVVRTGLDVAIGLLDQDTRVLYAGRAVALSLSNGLDGVRGILPSNGILYLARRNWSRSYGYKALSIPGCWVEKRDCR